MLILTRRLGEKLIIGDDIFITILGVKGNQIRIGIEAPKDVAVNRQEIYEKVLAERGEVKSFAIEKENREENIGNTIVSSKVKKTLEMINKNSPLTITGKP